MFILALGILNIPRQWLLIEAKIQRMKNWQRFFWYNISNDISDFVKKCEQCQKQGDLKSPKADLKPIPIPSTMMKQVGVDICNLPETDGYCHVIALIDYFWKWSEAKPKNSLVKVLEDNHEMWPHMIEVILFANRVSRRSSTKYSPFMMLYNRFIYLFILFI